MLLLDSRDPESQQQTAGRLGVDRTTMVGLLDGLEAKGLVARRADAEDRRRNVLELTRDGHTALARALRASDEAERQLLAELDDAESAQLRTLLTRLARDALSTSETVASLVLIGKVSGAGDPCGWSRSRSAFRYR